MMSTPETRLLSRSLPFLLAASLLLAACATPQDQQPESDNLAQILAHMREDPESRPASEAGCAKTLAARPGDFPYQAFIAGLFDVEPEASGLAFCAALIEMVLTSDQGHEALDAFRLRGGPDRNAALGILMREMMIANERVKLQRSKPPQQEAALLP